MDLIQAVVLGIVQGATEFVPVSSSGHLVLVPWLLGWEAPGLTFDTVVHLGTLAAVVAYFRRDWIMLIRAWLRGFGRWEWKDAEARCAWVLVAGTVPAAVIGFLFEGLFESLFSEPAWVSVFLMVTAGLLALSERVGRRSRGIEDLGWKDGLMIGFAQAAAIAPGISRSGATTAQGLFHGLARAEAARFSFLLSTPIILGAGLFKLLDLAASPELLTEIPTMLVGFATAAASGYVAVWGLLRYLQRGRLYGFAIYCALLGIACLVLALVL